MANVPFKLEPWAPNRFSNQGKTLEKLIERTMNHDFYVVRIPDAHSYGGFKPRGRVPCDFLGHICGHPLMVECKESAEESIPRSLLLRAKSRHQYEAMLSFASHHSNNRAGYLCHTAGRFLTWVPASRLQSVKQISRSSWDHSLQITGIDLLKDPLDWRKLLLDGEGT